MKMTPFTSLNKIALDMRETLKKKKCILLFAYNGTGKTRLAMEFKNAYINEKDTLYFNAFTEDLFIWNNDLNNDEERKLQLNQEAKYFKGLEGLDIENKIRPILQEFSDFDFRIDYDEWMIYFERKTIINKKEVTHENIKISRGEENTFIWCFFLAIAQFAIDAKEEGEPYYWVKYLYVDDPISSLDDSNAISIASNLALKIKKQDRLKVVISSHHTLFFNILSNELGNASKYFLKNGKNSCLYQLENIDKDATRFYHVAMLQELTKAKETGKVYLYHFNVLRILLEKTAAFHGFNDFIECLMTDDTKIESATLKRIIHAKNHGGYSLFEPVPMTEEDKISFGEILSVFINNYRFNKKLFPSQPAEIN